MIDRGELSQKEQYQHLFDFIKKNKKLHDVINHLNPDSSQVNLLLQAIHDGDFNADIFSDHDSHAYLLYLMKEGAIPFWHGMTVYVYLMILMQYSNKLALKEDDLRYHDNRDVVIEKLSINGEMTDEGMTYITNVFQKMSDIGVDINQEEFIKFCLGLSPAEQWLIKLPVDEYKNALQFDLLNIVAINLPFIRPMGKESIYYVIPSSSVIHFMLQAISPEPLQMQPIFGRINANTLERMHRDGRHPLPLYSPCVTSNMTEAHKRKSGPFPTWVHDLGHTFWGSMLSKRERTSIFDDFLPQLEQWKLEAKSCDDDKFVTYLDRVKTSLVDFDLTPIRKFAMPSLRFNDYIEKSFKFIVGIEKPSVYLEKLLFIFLRSYYSDAWDKEDKNRWIRVMANLVIHYAPDVQGIYHVIHAFTHMVQRISGKADSVNWSLDDELDKGKEIALSLASLNIKLVDNENICRAIQGAQNEATLWLGMRQFYFDSLVSLLVEQGLNFYPPYVGLENIQLVKNEKIREAFNGAVATFNDAKLNETTVVVVNANRREMRQALSRNQHAMFGVGQAGVLERSAAQIRMHRSRAITIRSKQAGSESGMKL